MHRDVFVIYFDPMLSCYAQKSPSHKFWVKVDNLPSRPRHWKVWGEALVP